MKLSRQLLKQLIAEEKVKLNEMCGDMPSQGLMVGHEMEQNPAVQHPSYAGSGDMSIADDHSDQEGQMALSQLQQIMQNADMLKGLVSEDDELQAWIQSKLTKASDYLDSVRGFLEYEMMPNRAQTISLQEGNLNFSKNGLKQIVAEELATLSEYGLAPGAPGASLGDQGQPSPQDVLRSSIMDAIDRLKAGNIEDALGTLEATLDAYTGHGELDSAVQDEG
jgi:hypothetical protein